MKDYVVLVNEENEPVGLSEKLFTHNANTPLHRGFSVFLINTRGELLLQQRSRKKKTWPLVWSNSCCGHPQLNETSIDAAKRKLQQELGITDARLRVILPEYRYRCEKDGIVENEFCPVIVGVTRQKPTINADEAVDTQWISWQDWLIEVGNNPDTYSQWCIEETILLNKSKEFQRFLQEATKKLVSK